jgi:hypothetical protein
LTLACSYALGERLVDFSKENARRRAEFYGHDVPVRATDYRLFVYKNEDGEFIGPAIAIHATNEAEAIAQAEAVRGASTGELFEMNAMRVIKRFSPNAKDPHQTLSRPPTFRIHRQRPAIISVKKEPGTH